MGKKRCKMFKNLAENVYKNVYKLYIENRDINNNNNNNNK
jgi:hypothetical protein